ncbi:PadR family transcriptional regulator [Rhizohabitans arisaemae]|uniref:PadR family transcriptional regulator n=1 Tax=Rhizohabitans arisaemae TaxID=2720610 RepID=UPI0024B0A1F1|nr:PadR family transcriptional regulator [Rhizohabitans arisaemae]
MDTPGNPWRQGDLHPGAPFPHLSPKVRRGDVRAAALSLLGEQPLNGYQVIQGIRERSHGVWRPSGGSVYPALQQLEDEGLIHGEETGGSRRFRLTDAGRAYIAARDPGYVEPWDEVAGTLPDPIMEMRLLWAQVAEVFAHLTAVANPAQVASANELLKSTRQAMFRILAEDQ